MIEQIRRLLDAMDAELVQVAKPGERLDLYHIGRSALILHYGAKGVGTKDFDIVWMRNSPLEDKVAEWFGQGTVRAQEIGLYLDRVAQGLPPLPQWFQKRCSLVPGDWRVLCLWELEPHDLAATKLKSFRPQDRQDLQFLCDAGLLAPGPPKGFARCRVRLELGKRRGGTPRKGFRQSTNGHRLYRGQGKLAVVVGSLDQPSRSPYCPSSATRTACPSTNSVNWPSMN
jgi:hypothetical protein